MTFAVGEMLLKNVMNVTLIFNGRLLLFKSSVLIELNFNQSDLRVYNYDIFDFIVIIFK